MPPKPEPSGAETIERLRSTLDEALDVARGLAEDPFFSRLVAVFQAMPAGDRSVIVGVLEKEVTARVLSRHTERPIGRAMHPNPNARLYMTSYDSAFDRGPYDRDDMMLADIRGLRIGTAIRYIPEIYELWKSAMREAMDHVDEVSRTAAEDLVRDILGCIDEARAAAKAAEAEAPAESEAADQSDEKKRTS
jgi:hypothetical protein